MTIQLYQVDAFTGQRFAGNPAAVVVLDHYPADALLQAVAAENNLAETAFLVPSRDVRHRASGVDWDLRWFSPTIEVPLCGHATLASAWVVFEVLSTSAQVVRFHSRYAGELTVHRLGEGYRMDFPVWRSRVAAEDRAAEVARALGVVPQQVLVNVDNYLAVLDSARAVRELTPDLAAIARLDRSAVLVTAAGDGAGHDCISRYFAPAKGIPEDAVTGGAHCALAPYWSERLAKSELFAHQASARGGELRCRVRGDRVELDGQCVIYLRGQIELGES